MNEYITIIGGGLAGTEAAYQIAKRGIKVKLYEMKPQKYSPAHSNENLAEIVCSNSFKSNLHTNACGLLKEELRKLDSLLIKIADKTIIVLSAFCHHPMLYSHIAEYARSPCSLSSRPTFSLFSSTRSFVNNLTMPTQINVPTTATAIVTNILSTCATNK